MAEHEAKHTMVVRVTATELAKAHQLAGDLHEPISVVIRRWIRDGYQQRFGDAKPEAPTLRNGERLRLPR